MSNFFGSKHKKYIIGSISAGLLLGLGLGALIDYASTDVSLAEGLLYGGLVGAGSAGVVSCAIIALEKCFSLFSCNNACLTDCFSTPEDPVERVVEGLKTVNQDLLRQVGKLEKRNAEQEKAAKAAADQVAEFQKEHYNAMQQDLADAEIDADIHLRAEAALEVGNAIISRNGHGGSMESLGTQEANQVLAWSARFLSTPRVSSAGGTNSREVTQATHVTSLA